MEKLKKNGSISPKRLKIKGRLMHKITNRSFD